MTTDKPHDDDTAMARETLDTWPALTPPPDFVDRVMSARGAAPSRRPSRWAAAGALVALAAGMTFIVVQRPGERSTGTLSASVRETVTLGRRAVAVAEPGAELRWLIRDDGDASIEQPAGAVFYRVNAPQPFTVHTPAGAVSVHGTCFSVEVSPMVRFKEAVLGAALGAGVVVTVYEGKVSLANAQGKTLLSAGEEGRMEAGAAPTRAEVASKRGALTLPEVEDGASPSSPVTAQAELALARVQVATLQAQLQQVKGELATVRSAPAAPVRRSQGQISESYFKPTKDELIRMAQTCRVQVDMPNVMQTKAPTLGKNQIKEWGVTEDEVPVIDRKLAEFHKHVSAELRASYVEVTGDADTAKWLSPFSLLEEIEEQIPKEQRAEFLQKLSAERAGLTEKPADFSSLSAQERFFRNFTEYGNAFESLLASELGAQRAHEIRAAQDGWPGSHFGMSGCPE